MGAPRLGGVAPLSGSERRELEGFDDGVHFFELRLGRVRSERGREHQACPVHVEDVNDLLPSQPPHALKSVSSPFAQMTNGPSTAIPALGAIQARRLPEFDPLAGHGSRSDLANDGVGAYLIVQGGDEVVNGFPDQHKLVRGRIRRPRP